MPTVIATLVASLLAAGTLLAGFGVAGFLGNWRSGPDHDSIRFVQVLSSIGRNALYTAALLHLLAHALPNTPPALWLAAIALAFATYLTRTTNTIVPAAA